MRNFLLSFFLVAFVSTAAMKAQCALIQGCQPDSVTVCDLTNNDPLLWNEPYWLDPVHNSHDLSEQTAQLSLAVRDSCGGSGLAIRGVLYLDLDADGVPETAIDSDSTYDPGVVPFGNLDGPATPRVFDARPVLPAQKFRFQLQLDTAGDVVTASLGWQSGPGFFPPQLPAGTHRMAWQVTQDGATDTCAYTVTVIDCAPPTIVPIQNGLSANILANQMLTLWVSDFYLYAEDNVTPMGQLQHAIRRAGSGTGFPLDALGYPITSVTFSCLDLGIQFVEVWSRDAAGNAAFVQSFVLVQDNQFNCNLDPANLSVCIVSETEPAVENVEIQIDGLTPGVPPVGTWPPLQPWTFNGSCYVFNQALPVASGLVVSPHKSDNPLNGVSTFDLVLISRHILGLETLNTPYKMIAADANKSNSVTTLDIVELRKLILGFYTELPNNDSWRFVDRDYVFPNPANPFAAPFPEQITIVQLQQNGFGTDFVGLKVGDVNGTALSAALAPTVSDDRTGPVLLAAPKLDARVGEIVELPFYSANISSILGLQLSLDIDARYFEVLDVASVALDDFSSANYHMLSSGGVRLSWHSAQGQGISAYEPLFSLRLRAKTTGAPRDAIRLAEDGLSSEYYPVEGGRRVFALELGECGARTPLQAGPAQPNPTAAGAELAVTLPRACSVTLELRDVAGRLLYTSEHWLDAGRHRLALPAGTFAGAGIYTWRVLAGGEAVSGKVAHR